MKLSELKTGEKGVIIKVLGHGGFRRRIIEMGFIKGKTVEVVLNAPLKDPIKYKIMGYEVSLRRQEADMIEIVSEEEARRTAATDTYHEPISQGIPVSDEVMKNIAQGKRRTINVALVGNPNCGKTSLFNVASGGAEKFPHYHHGDVLQPLPLLRIPAAILRTSHNATHGPPSRPIHYEKLHKRLYQNESHAKALLSFQPMPAQNAHRAPTLLPEDGNCNEPPHIHNPNAEALATEPPSRPRRSMPPALCCQSPTSAFLL